MVENKQDAQEHTLAPTFRNPDVFNPRAAASTFNIAARLYSGLPTPNMVTPRDEEQNAGHDLPAQKILINDQLALL